MKCQGFNNTFDPKLNDFQLIKAEHNFWKFQVDIVGFENCDPSFGSSSPEGLKMLCAGGVKKGPCYVS